MGRGRGGESVSTGTRARRTVPRLPDSLPLPRRPFLASAPGATLNRYRPSTTRPPAEPRSLESASHGLRLAALSRRKSSLSPARHTWVREEGPRRDWFGAQGVGLGLGRRSKGRGRGQRARLKKERSVALERVGGGVTGSNPGRSSVPCGQAAQEPEPWAAPIPGIPVAHAALAAVAWRLRGATSARSPAAGTWRRRPEFLFPRRRSASCRAFPGMSLAEGECPHLPGAQGLGGTVPAMLFSRGGCRAGEVSACFHLLVRMEARDPGGSTVGHLTMLKLRLFLPLPKPYLMLGPGISV